MCLNIEAPLALSKVNTTLWFISKKKKSESIFFYCYKYNSHKNNHLKIL